MVGGTTEENILRDIPGTDGKPGVIDIEVSMDDMGVLIEVTVPELNKVEFFGNKSLLATGVGIIDVGSDEIVNVGIMWVSCDESTNDVGKIDVCCDDIIDVEIVEVLCDAIPVASITVDKIEGT